MEKIRLKCRFGNDIRTVIANQNTVIVDLKKRLSNDFGFEVALKYEDRDGDLITLSSQDDLSDLLQYATSDSINVVVTESTALPQLNLKGNISQQNLSRASGSVLVAPMSSSGKETPNISKPGGVFNVNTSVSTGVSPANGPFPKLGQVIIPRVERFPNIADSNRFHEQAPSVIRWKRAEMLGQGAFGVVYLGLNIDTGELMAVKQMATEEVSKRELSSLENEINLLRNLRHPNIVRYIGTELTSSALSIFLEYVPGGSLKTLIDKFGALEESVARSYTRQLLLGLEYLHRNGIAHRDIKGANCLVGNDGVIKLADFGNSKHWRPVAATATGGTNFTQTGDIKGTPAWMAPEVVKDQGTNISWRKADIWSLGCTTLEMTTGRAPWSQFSNSVTILYHLACQDTLPEYPTNPSPELLTFLNVCFQRDPSLRPDATSLLLHPFVAPQATWGQIRPTTMSSLMIHSDGDFHQHLGRGATMHQSIAQFPNTRRNQHHAAPVSASQTRESVNISQPTNEHHHFHIAPRTAEQPQTAREPLSADNTTILARDRVPNTAREVVNTSSTAVNPLHGTTGNALNSSATFVYYDPNPENTHEAEEIHMIDAPRVHAGGAGNVSLPDRSILMAAGEDRPGTNTLTADDSLNSPLPNMLDDSLMLLDAVDRNTPSPLPMTSATPVTSTSTPSQKVSKRLVTNGNRKQSQSQVRKSTHITETAASAQVSISFAADAAAGSVTSTTKQSYRNKGSSAKPKVSTNSNALIVNNSSGTSQAVPALEMRQVNKKATMSSANIASITNTNANSTNANTSSPSNVPNANSAVRRSSPNFKPSLLTQEKSSNSLVTQSVSNIPLSTNAVSTGASSHLLPPGSSLHRLSVAPNRVGYDSDDGVGGSASSFLAHDTDNESSLLYADDELGSVDGGSLAGDVSVDLLHMNAASQGVGFGSSDSRASSLMPLTHAISSPRMDSPRLGSMLPPNSARVLLNPIDPTSLHHSTSTSASKEKNHLLRPVMSLKEPVGSRIGMDVSSSSPGTGPSMSTPQAPLLEGAGILSAKSADWQDNEEALEVEEEEQVARQFHSSFGGKGGRLQSNHHNGSLKGTLGSMHNEIEEDIDGDTFVDMDTSITGHVNGSLLLESVEKLPILDISSADPTPVIASQYRSKEGRKALNKSLELTAHDLSDTAIVPVASNSSKSTAPMLVSSPYQRQQKTHGRNSSSANKHGHFNKDTLSNSGNFILDNNGGITPATSSNTMNKANRKTSSRRTNASNRANVHTRGNTGNDSADNSLLGINTSDMLDISCDSLESLHVSGVNVAGNVNARSSLQSRQLQPAATTVAMLHGLHQPQPPSNSSLIKMKSFNGNLQESIDNNVDYGEESMGMHLKGTVDSVQPQTLPSVSELLRQVDPVVLDDHQGAVTRLRAPRKAPHMLVSSSMDGTVRLWSTMGGQYYESGQDSCMLQKLVLTVDGFVPGGAGSSSNAVNAATAVSNGENRRVVSLGLKAPSMDDGDLSSNNYNNDNGSLAGSLTGTGNTNNIHGKSMKITDIWTEDTAETIWAVCSDGAVRLWSINMDTGWHQRPLRIMKGHEDGITCIAGLDATSNLGPQGSSSFTMSNTTSLAATGSMDRTIRLWDARARKPQVFLFRGHGDTVLSLAWSEEGRALISGSKDRMIKIWDTRAGRLRSTGEKHFGAVHTIRTMAAPTANMNMAGTSVSTAGHNGLGGEILLQHHVNTRGTSAGGLTGNMNNTQNNYSTNNPVGGSGTVSHYNQENALAFVSVGRDAMINFWNYSGDCISSQTAHRGNTICMSNINTITSIFGPQTLSNLSQQHNHAMYTTGVPMPPMLITVGADSLMKIWDLRRARCAAEISTSTSSQHTNNPSGTVNKLVWTSPASFVAGFTNGSLRLYEKDTQSTSSSTAADPSTAACDWQGMDMNGHLGSACTDVVTADGYVACSGKNGRILRWRIPHN